MTKFKKDLELASSELHDAEDTTDPYERLFVNNYFMMKQLTYIKYLLIGIFVMFLVILIWKV